MKIDKQQIINRAMEMFLQYGYEGTSITKLQESLHIGRATLYYYFKDKNDLFHSVSLYFVKELSIIDMNNQKEISLGDMIEMQIRLFSKIRSELMALYNKEVKLHHLKHLFQTSISLFKDVEQIHKQYQKNLKNAWTQAIQYSMDHHEISKDVQVVPLANLFMSIQDSSSKVFTPDTVKLDREYISSYFYLYELVKTH